VVLLFVAGGVTISATIDRGTGAPVARPASAAVLAAPVLSFVRRPGTLELDGVTASARHEERLRRRIAERFDADTPRLHLRPGVVLPTGWETTTLRLLDVLAATDSADAVLTGGRVSLRGVTTDPVELHARLDALGAASTVAVRQDFVVVDPEPPIVELCRRDFARAAAGPVEFARSSAEIRASSYATLDRVVNAADDCRDDTITITGHTDSTGSEAWNLRLSRERAGSVAGYLQRHGIDPERLRVEGLGSSVPIADDDTPHGRSLNRRIEFEFGRPSP
jgi:outer membrane protein OmpA-like peptidoglycan-associated protein